MAELKYRRILLKLGGEALAEGGFGINPSQAEDLAQKIVQVLNLGVDRHRHRRRQRLKR